MKRTISRHERLNRDLLSYNPKRWNMNIPFKDYSVRVEDFIPALSGAIGKVALVAAFAVAWAEGLGIGDPSFVTENVRLEIVIASLLAIIFCAILNPYTGPPGTLAPLVPIIPVMIISGVHPLPLSILIGLIGLIISIFKYFSKIIEINGVGTKGGIILLFGFLGISSSLGSLQKWASTTEAPSLYVILLAAGLILYVILNIFNKKWLVIPLASLTALIVSGIFGVFPVLETSIAFPIINPSWWWNEAWGIGWGFSVENFVTALPFALLAVVMWPIDALAVKTIQETNYPDEAKNAIFDMNATYMLVSLRNIFGAVLGGSQIAAIWRSFMIPLGIVKRPIGGSVLLLGILGISFGILGFPIDIAVFPPLLWLVLIFGVFLPLLEIGLNMIKTPGKAQIAAICLITGIALNPVLGWILAIFIENFKLLKDPGDKETLSLGNKYLTVVIVIIVLVSYMLTNTV